MAIPVSRRPAGSGGGGRGPGQPRGPFQLCPAGMQQAVCCDVVDLGWENNPWGGQDRRQHKIRIKWQSEQLMTDGRPFLVQKKYTLSLDPKASLTKDLESWRARRFTELEAQNFDVETLIGVNCYINVMHTKKPKGTYADVVTVMPIPKGKAKLVVRDYQRQVVQSGQGGGQDDHAGYQDAGGQFPPDEAETPYQDQHPEDEGEKPPF